jgi:DNA-binding GntR family transcriptional regulator
MAHSLSPIQVPNVNQVVYDVLRGNILTGRFVPGQQLNLRDLEEQLEVSRTPLKIALERLQVDGLVSVHPRRGTYVTTFDATDLKECFQVRIALEAEALRHIFAPHNREMLRYLIGQFDEMDTYFTSEATWLEELIPFMDIDRSAHHNIVSLATNTRMVETYERANVQGFIAIMGTKFVHGDTLRTQSEHREMNIAFKNGNLNHVLEAARHHLEGASDRALHRLTGKETSV